jgi:hypothetical protein
MYWDHCHFSVATERTEPDYRISDGEVRDTFSEAFDMARSFDSWSEW